MTSIRDQIQIFKRGAVELISEEELAGKLERSQKEKKPLRIKYGADPSAPDIHLGHTVPLRKLREIQDLGHHIIFLIGDFTARIGDPTGVSETRKPLTQKEVEENAKTYQEQAFKILDKKRTEVVFNSEWLDKMKPNDFLTLTSHYTVARLLERDDFKKRFESNRPVALLEFLYPLLQGYDSVALNSDLELGGTDQKFNLLVGRELQRVYGKSPQIVMTLPIIEGTDGVQKMSKSLGNYIGVKDEPSEMFGKVMSIPDSLMVRYATYLTGWDEATVDRHKQMHPRDFKVSLGKKIVSLYHGEKKADEAALEFDRIFKDKQMPQDMPLVTVDRSKLREGDAIDLVPLLFELQLVSSKMEARRMIEQGGVKINQIKISNVNETVSLAHEITIQCGKRKFARVKKA
ncbi:MAG: tyrosine--tRNA ligase [Candidatus Omnitrophica bacterium]|nr:tyrosine--tRNA ligase [Candidatus Omnitrophota bacterium]